MPEKVKTVYSFETDVVYTPHKQSSQRQLQHFLHFCQHIKFFAGKKA